MRFSTRGRRLLAGVVSLGVFAATSVGVAAAGESGSGGSSMDPIKVGTIIWNNPIANQEIKLAGIKAAVRAINEDGGINGREVEWTLCELANPNEGEACARRMVDEGFVATLSDGTFIAEQATTSILGDAGIIQLDPQLTSTEVFSAPNVYSITPGNPIEFSTIPQYMKKKKAKKVHFVSAQIQSATDNQDVVERAADFYGLEVVGTTQIPITAADYSPFVQDAVGADADANVTILSPNQATLLVEAAQQLGAQLHLGSLARQFTNQQYEEWGKKGGALDESFLVNPVPPFSAKKQFPELKRAERELAAECKAGDDLACPDQLSLIQVQSWLGVQAFKRVVESLDEVTAETVSEGFETAKDLELGLIPPWTPSAEGAPGFENVSNPWMYLITVKNGKAVLAQKKPIDGLAPFREK